MNSGLMYELGSLNLLDFSQEKFEGNGVHKLMSKGDKIYAMKAATPEPRGCLYFNKRLLEEAGIDPADLYKWQANGEWTWEKFEEVCKQVHRDTDANGTIDVFGMAHQTSEFHKSAVIANGGSFIDKDENGMLFNDLESKETIEALNWTVDMTAKYQMTQPEGSEWNWFMAEFINGSAAFLTGQVYMAGQDLKDMEDDFGCVAFPMGPSAGGKYIGFFEDNVLAIPACYDADKAWKLAFAYDVYTAPVPGFEDNDMWKASYYGNFRDTEAVDETLVILIDNGVLMYHTMVPGIELGSDILWGLGWADAEGVVYTPAQKGEQLREAWNAYINDANK